MTHFPPNLRLNGDQLDAWHRDLTLKAGSHDTPEGGMCVMEAVAWITGDYFNATPSCVHSIIRSFAMSWNDALIDNDRDRLLKPLMWDMIGTNNQEPEVTDALAWMTTDWLVRVHAPAWLRLAGLTEHAESLAFSPALTAESVTEIMPILEAASSAAIAERDNVWSGIRDIFHGAAWFAAGVAVREAGGPAARSAVAIATKGAAQDSTEGVIQEAAKSAAENVAWNAARTAASIFARDTTSAAQATWETTSKPTRDRLQPTVTELQDSAVDLLTRMCTHAKANSSIVSEPHGVTSKRSD